MPTSAGQRLGKTPQHTLLFAEEIGERVSKTPTALNPDPSSSKREPLAPDKIVGQIVIYGVALHSAIFFLHVLYTSIMHEFGR